MNNQRVIKLGYSLLQNAGDAFNKPLVEKMSGALVMQSKVANAELLALGGSLANLQFSKEFKHRLLQRIAGSTYAKKPLYVWGSGFLYEDNDAPFYRKNLVFCALRGELSRRKVSKLIGKEIAVPLCDPGLLIGDVYTTSGKKQYSMGIISHYIERDNPYFEALHRQCPDSVLIDIRNTPDAVAEVISQCESIASSSLHGLVFADALGIPNIRLKVTGKIAGGDFKFNDYYSSYGLTVDGWDVTKKKRMLTVKDIEDYYAIIPHEVETMKHALCEVFPNIG